MYIYTPYVYIYRDTLYEHKVSLMNLVTNLYCEHVLNFFQKKKKFFFVADSLDLINNVNFEPSISYSW